MPFASKRPGKKLLIGDQLASHFSPNVIKLAHDNDIYFTVLSSNSTNLLQPLDVAYFRSLKVHWRAILGNWRAESRSKGSIPKEVFPIMLTQVLEKSKRTGGPENIKSGFRATGLYPRNVEEPLKHLPGTSAAAQCREDVQRDLDSTLIQMLSERRGLNEKKKPRGSKIIPGKQLLPVSSTSSGDPGSGSSSSIATTSASAVSDENSDDKCFVCGALYINYRGPDWLQCTFCEEWLCGYCNGESTDPYFTCDDCSS